MSIENNKPQWRSSSEPAEDDDDDSDRSDGKASDDDSNSHRSRPTRRTKRRARQQSRGMTTSDDEYSSTVAPQRFQPYNQDPRFMPREKWVTECFMAIRRGNLQRVMQIFSSDGGHPNAINFQIFNMGFPVGAGGTMKLPSSSTALHVAAWCGQSDIVRWLLNNGGDAEARDGLHQLPVEVASTLDVRRVLGAAKGIVSLSDKVERVTEDLNDGIALVGDKFAIRLARIQAELGEIDYKIETAVREAAREEVLELRAALARKLARELQRFARSQKEVKTDPLVWEKMNKLERYQVDIDNLHKYIDEIKDEMDRKPMLLGQEQEGEVEAGTELSLGSADKREIRQLRKQADKNEKIIRSKGKDIEELTVQVDDLHERLERMEIAQRTKGGGCCVIS